MHLMFKIASQNANKMIIMIW